MASQEIVERIKTSMGLYATAQRCLGKVEGNPKYRDEEKTLLEVSKKLERLIDSLLSLLSL